MTKGMSAYGGQGLYRGEGPCRPPNGRHVFYFISRDLIANLKKKIHLRSVALWGGDRGYFWNISKWIYIFKILIFKKYKKEKTARPAWIQIGPVLAIQSPLRSGTSPHLWPSGTDPSGNWVQEWKEGRIEALGAERSLRFLSFLLFRKQISAQNEYWITPANAF